MSGVILDNKNKREYVERAELEAFAVEVSQALAELFQRTERIGNTMASLVGALVEAEVISVEASEGETEETDAG